MANASDTAVHTPIGKTCTHHCVNVSLVLSWTDPLPTAATDTNQPKTLPREDTAMGQRKLVSVMMCLLLRMMAVLNATYRSDQSAPLT